jgi:large subunit ribosomal protein L18
LRQQRGRKKVIGSSDRPRLSVFISNKQVYAQIIDDRSGKTLVSSSTLGEDLKQQAVGKNKTDMAKLVGERVAALAKEAGISKVVFDKSGYKYGKRLDAMAGAARKGGLQF